jgi:hypothetical protein
LVHSRNDRILCIGGVLHSNDGGALAANYLFRVNFVVAVQDKDSNVVIASAAGVICALVLVLVSLWISVLMSERRSEKRELAQLPTLPPTGR